MQAETTIHPTAVVEPGARLGAGVAIGPFCHVSAEAIVGDRVELVSHVSILGATTLGEDCKVFPMAILGAPPQNSKHKGGRTTLVVGRNCTIREGVTMHRGTDTSRGETTVGDNGNFLAYAHIAHDCVVGKNVTMANVATLGGHVEVGDFVNIGGLSAVHQMCRIGHHAFIGGATILVGDLIPYGMAIGNRASLRGLNIIGMKRSGLPRAEILALRQALRMIFDRDRTVGENLDLATVAFAHSVAVGDVIAFMRDRGKRHYVVPRLGRNIDDSSDDED
jgi:UDP-N-acetylglucosamine acyltransferase